MTRSEFRLEPSVASAFRRFWWLIVVALIVGAGGAWIFSKSQTQEYTSTATMAIPEPFGAAASDSAGGSSAGSSVSSEYVAQQVADLQTPAVAHQVVQIVKSKWPHTTLTSQDVTNDLSISPPTSSLNNSTVNAAGQVGITFTAPEGLGAPAAKLAAVASNAVVTAYQQQRLTQIKSQTNRESTDLNSELSTVNSQLLNVEGQINALQQQENAAAAAQQTQEQALLNEGQKVPATSTPPQDAQLASLQTLETNLTQRQSDLLTQLDNLQSAEQQSLNQPLGVIPATESSKPSRPNMVADVGIGAALLLVLGAIAAYVLALYRRRFSDRHEPEGLYGAALLGDIPDFKSEHIESALPIVDARMSVAAESFRFIVASLRSVSADTELGVIAVTTANGASGKTTVTANLALALAESGCRVLAIDGDFVRWGLSALLSGHELSHDRSGLAEVISGRTKLVDAVVPCALRGGDLVDLLPPGAAQPRLPISDSKEAHAFLAESAAYYDYVILDGLPLEQAAYGWDVISFANSTIMVVRHKEPVRPHLELPELLDRTETRLIGYVYNRGPLRRNVGSYYRRFSGASSAGTASQNGKEASTPNVIDSALHRSLSESR